jgi:hypothetical protein
VEAGVSTLEERITAALSDEIASSDLVGLIAETEEAITTADVAAEAERIKALDPIASRMPRKRVRQWRRPALLAIACATCCPA